MSQYSMYRTQGTLTSTTPNPFNFIPRSPMSLFNQTMGSNNGMLTLPSNTTTFASDNIMDHPLSDSMAMLNIGSSTNPNYINIFSDSPVDSLDMETDIDRELGETDLFKFYSGTTNSVSTQAGAINATTSTQTTGDFASMINDGALLSGTTSTAETATQTGMAAAETAEEATIGASGIGSAMMAGQVAGSIMNTTLAAQDRAHATTDAAVQASKSGYGKEGAAMTQQVATLSNISDREAFGSLMSFTLGPVGAAFAQIYNNYEPNVINAYTEASTASDINT